MRRTPLPNAFTLRSLVLALSLSAIHGMLPPPAYAQPATPQTDSGHQAQIDFSIPAGSLGTAIGQFGLQAGIPIRADAELIQGLTTPGLEGRYTPTAGLQRLLSGSRLEAIPSPQGGFILQSIRTQAGMQTLDTITVRGSGSATTEGTQSYMSDTISIGKGDRTLREIPQAVSVITRQRIEDQNITDIHEALQNAPGVTLISNEPGGHAYSRGFFIDSYQFDGVPLERQLYARGSSFNSDMAIYDRVEILRGAQGLFEGAGNPSGSINLVRKRPTHERQAIFSTAIGSWDTGSVQADLGGALNANGTVRGRLVAHYGKANSFRDYLNARERTLYAALDIDLGPATTLGLGFSSEKPYGRMDWQGLPNYPDGSMPDYGRSTNLSTPWSRRSKAQDTYYLDLGHRFNEDWAFKLSTVKVDEFNDQKYLLRRYRTGTPTSIHGDVYYFDMHSSTVGADAYLDGKTTLFGRALRLTAGANFSHQSSKDLWGWKRDIELFGSDYFGVSTIPEPSAAEILAANRMDDGYRSRKHGMYMAADYALTDRLNMILGGRLSSFNQTYTSDGAWGLSETNASISNEFTAFAGLSHALDAQWSVYGNYAEIFLPQSQRDVTGAFLTPITGRNYEVGIKGDILEGRALASFALFRTEQHNIAFEDDAVSETVANVQCGGTCYRSSANVRSQGFEAEVNGEVLRGMQLSASYTYTSVKYLGDTPGVGYNISANTGLPRHILRLWANYRLPGEWHRLSVGGGMNVQSRAAGFGYNGRIQGGYTVLNARLAYQFTPAFSAALNIDNLTDKRYFSSTSYSHNFYGAPRNWMLTLRYQM